MKKGGAIDIGRQSKPVLGVNPTQTASLNFTEIHNLKSSLIKPLRSKNSILRIGLNTQESSNSSYYPANGYPTFSITAALCNYLAKNEPG